jgi:hypothetical protein
MSSSPPSEIKFKISEYQKGSYITNTLIFRNLETSNLKNMSSSPPSEIKFKISEYQKGSYITNTLIFRNLETFES